MRHFKFLLLLFIIACSCAPEVDFRASGMPVFLDEPAEADIAGKMFALSDDCPVESLELTESGRFLLTYVDKGDDDRGKYSYGDYHFRGGELLLGDSAVVKTAEEDSPVVKEGEEESVMSWERTNKTEFSPHTVNLCRSWQPAQTVFIIRPANAPKVGMSFTGCDVAEILAAVRKTGANLSNVRKAGKNAPALKEAVRLSEKYKGRAEGMKVTDITFTKKGTFIIGFDNENPYVGQWKWLNEENGLLYCSFIIPDDNNEDYTVESTCQILYDAAGNADLTVDASFTSRKVPYLTTIDILCNEYSR